MTTTFKMVDGDIFFDVNGRLGSVEDFDKVSQDIAEILLTDFDVERDYGSELVLVDASPVFNVSESQVTGYVLDAIERLRSLQGSNQNTTLQEEIAAIESIEVFKNDQTEITFGLSVITSAGPAIEAGVRLEQRPVSLNHLLPPSASQATQDFSARAATVLSGQAGAAPVAVEENTWDNLVWDQGTWG